MKKQTYDLEERLLEYSVRIIKIVEQLVGWVERSETQHYICAIIIVGLSAGLALMLHYVSLRVVPQPNLQKSSNYQNMVSVSETQQIMWPGFSDRN